MRSATIILTSFPYKSVLIDKSNHTFDAHQFGKRAKTRSTLLSQKDLVDRAEKILGFDAA